MTVGVVFVHGIRTSATMWRAQVDHLRDAGHESIAVDLPGHGTRIDEPFTLESATQTIDEAVVTLAERVDTVILAAHSMGGLISTAYVGREDPPQLGAFVAAGCTALPRGFGLRLYRALARGFDRLPGRGQRIADLVLARTLPLETRADFGAGGYAYDAQDVALKSLSVLDLVDALRRITIPTWFVNGQYDQLRVNERLFTGLVPHAELIIVPRATHLVTAMRPEVFNGVLDLAIATVQTPKESVES